MKIIKNEQIVSKDISSKEYLTWVDEALVEKRNVILPGKTSLVHKEGHFYNIMPCILPELNLSGLKVVTRYPDRIPTIQGEIFLYNLENGELLSVIDAVHITRMRTAAVAVHSIHLLAKEDYQTVGWIGLGDTARSTVKIFLETTHSKNLTFVIHKYKEHHNKFIEYIESINHSNNITFELVESYSDVVSKSDVLISAVSYAKDDFCTFESIREGTLIVPIHTRGFMEIDYLFDKVFGDDINHVKHFRHFEKYPSFHEVSEVIHDQTLGRTSEKEKIIVYNIGIAIHDLVFAKKYYDIVSNKNE